MAEDYKILAQSQIPNSAAAVYTVPALTQTIIKHLVVVNPAGNGDVTLSLWHNGSTDAVCLLSAATILEGGWMEDDSPYTMDAGDTIEAEGSVNNALTITLHGLEISP